MDLAAHEIVIGDTADDPNNAANTRCAYHLETSYATDEHCHAHGRYVWVYSTTGTLAFREVAVYGPAGPSCWPSKGVAASARTRRRTTVWPRPTSTHTSTTRKHSVMSAPSSTVAPDGVHRATAVRVQQAACTVSTTVAATAVAASALATAVSTLAATPVATAADAAASTTTRGAGQLLQPRSPAPATSASVSSTPLPFSGATSIRLASSATSLTSTATARGGRAAASPTSSAIAVRAAT